MHNNKKRWTPEEEDFLLESYGSTGMKYMMSHLHRSEEAIKQRYRELTGFEDMLVAGGMLTPRQVGPALGVSHKTVINWIHNHGLMSHQLHKPTSAKKGARFRHFIDPQVLWRWIAKNKEKINFSQVKKGVILPEPRWLEEEIKKSLFQKRSVNWTKDEEEMAFFWWQGGTNYREISKRLGRPPKGVQRKLTAIRKRKGVEHGKTN